MGVFVFLNADALYNELFIQAFMFRQCALFFINFGTNIIYLLLLACLFAVVVVVVVVVVVAFVVMNTEV